MLFSTPFFLFGFLPVFFALYKLLPARRWVLLTGSLIFYGWGEPRFLFVVLASSLLDWFIGRRIARQQSYSRHLVIVGVVSNIALLVYAKYTTFAVVNLNSVFTSAGWQAWPVPRIALPLGVSFIAFEKITYLVDLFRKAAPPAKSLLDYLNYVFLFPKLLAGPIIKYHDIAGQLSQPGQSYSDFRDGLVRFIQGLAMKVLIADLLAPVATDVFALPAAALDASTAWLGLVSFTFQIYFDFSGYSDMAIGMAQMLGFRVMENFRQPYLATSFTDFWRRWHISLSTWIKEYLYIPLGGNRGPTWRTYGNLCICFLLCGLWHGAAWNFIVWGAIHGLVLVCDRAFWLRISQRLPALVNVALTFGGIMFTWVFFRCASLHHALRFFGGLFRLHAIHPNTVFLRPDTIVVLVVATLLCFAPALAHWQARRSDSATRTPALACACALLLVCAGRITVSAFQPFLYFRF